MVGRGTVVGCGPREGAAGRTRTREANEGESELESQKLEEELGHQWWCAGTPPAVVAVGLTGTSVQKGVVGGGRQVASMHLSLALSVRARSASSRFFRVKGSDSV